MDKIKPGQTCQIAELPKGRAISLRLAEMGLREGMMITIKNTMPMRGPILVSAGQTQIAIGHGTARKIIVKTK